MAIYIGIELQEQIGRVRTYRFFKSDGKSYGTLSVDTDTGETAVLTIEDKNAEHFAFPRARHAIEKAMRRGALPDRLTFSA